MGTTAFPGAVDNFATTSPTNLGDDDSTGRTHSERHDDMEAAMEAVQTSVLGAWTSYTPQVDQGVSTNISKTVTYARWMRLGNLIVCQMQLAITGTGTSGSAITASLPVTAAQIYQVVGSGYVYDNGVAAYGGPAFLESTGTVSVVNTSTGRVGATPAFALASGDAINIFAAYEPAA